MKPGIKGIVKLSCTYNLRNTAITRGTLGEIEISLSTANLLFLRLFRDGGATKLRQAERKWNNTNQTIEELFQSQFQDWLEAIHARNLPTVSGIEAQRSVVLIERCYANQQLLKLCPGCN